MQLDFNEKKRLGLYFHIPFCLSKCAYCDFNSFVLKDSQIAQRYISSIITHMQSYKCGVKNYRPDSVYFGGGTPTFLDKEVLVRLVHAVKKIFDLDKRAEITIEANPATVSLSQLKQLRRLGVNRLSIGLQSADNNELKALSRIHTRKDFIESYRMARSAKFENINVDIMFGIPYQTYDSLLKTLNFVTCLGPEHISLYNLKIEPGTPFYRERETVTKFTADEDTELAMYLSAIEFLNSRGYVQYEISNFSRPGFQCRHNLKYWNCEEYLGFGVSAHSYFNGNRFSFISEIEQYMSSVENMESDIPLTSEIEELESRERMGEYIMLRLRLNEGINSIEFARKFGVSFETLYGRKIAEYLKNGYMIRRSGSYSLTPNGMFVSNYILSDILEFEDLGSYVGKM